MPAFEANPQLLSVIGTLAKRYRKWPHEVLELDPYEIGLAMLVYTETEQQSAKQLDAMARSGTPIFPVVVLKD